MKKCSFYSLLFTIFNDLLNISIVIVIFAPMLMGSNAIFLQNAALGAKTTILGFLLAAFPLAQFLTSPLFGAVSDAIGRKKSLTIALSGCFVCNVLSALSIYSLSLPLLFISRFFAGAFAGNVPLAQAAIADLSTEKEKTKNLSSVGIVASLAWIVGAPIGGILSNDHIVSWFDFAVPFWFSAVLFLINIIWLSFSFEESLKKADGNAASFREEVKNIQRVFQIPRMPIPLITLFLYYMGWMSYIYFFPAVFVYRFDFDQSEIGYIAGYTALFFFVGSFIVRKLSMKVAAEKLFLFPLMIVGIGVLISGFLPVFWPYLIIFIFACSSSAIVWVSYLGVLSNLAGEKNQGKVFGVQQSLLSLATLLCPILAGIIAPIYIGLPFILAGILLLFGLVLYYFSFYIASKKYEHL